MRHIPSCRARRDISEIKIVSALSFVLAPYSPSSTSPRPCYSLNFLPYSPYCPDYFSVFSSFFFYPSFSSFSFFSPTPTCRFGCNHRWINQRIACRPARANQDPNRKIPHIRGRALRFLLAAPQAAAGDLLRSDTRALLGVEQITTELMLRARLAYAFEMST